MELWIVSDNFIAESYRENFLHVKGLYAKKAFEVHNFCNSRYTCNNRNMLSRIQHAVLRGINKRFKLPDFILIVLDNDLAQFLNYNAAGTASLIGSWIEWLTKQIADTIQKRKQELPLKAVKA